MGKTISSNMSRDVWIRNTAVFYFQIFNAKYDDLFLMELLKGGGGNSTLCGSWMKLSTRFVRSRISGSALIELGNKNIPFTIEEDRVGILKKTLDRNWAMFSSNSKGSIQRELSGKFFHFDHNPSNKHILSLINNKVKELSLVSLTQKAKIELLSDFISDIQTVDLITVKQDDERTNADRSVALSKDVRDKLLDDKWYYLSIL
jgi:hypothetical protein